MAEVAKAAEHLRSAGHETSAKIVMAQGKETWAKAG